MNPKRFAQNYVVINIDGFLRYNVLIIILLNANKSIQGLWTTDIYQENLCQMINFV